jgi:hypothetical protein
MDERITNSQTFEERSQPTVKTSKLKKILGNLYVLKTLVEYGFK